MICARCSGLGRAVVGVTWKRDGRVSSLHFGSCPVCGGMGWAELGGEA